MVMMDIILSLPFYQLVLVDKTRRVAFITQLIRTSDNSLAIADFESSIKLAATLTFSVNDAIANAEQAVASGFTPSIVTDLAIAITDGSSTTAGVSGNKISQINGALGTTYAFEQSVGTYQPDRIIDSSFNGKPYLKTYGTTYLETLSQYTTPGTAITTFFIGETLSSTYQFLFASSDVATRPYVMLDNGGGSRFYAVNENPDDAYSTGGAWAANVPNIFVFKTSGTTTKFFNKDGVVSLANDFVTATPFKIGMLFTRFGLDGIFNGKFAAGLVYSSALADGDITTIINEAKSYYAIV